jgi:hypothetical protein
MVLTLFTLIVYLEVYWIWMRINFHQFNKKLPYEVKSAFNI